MSFAALALVLAHVGSPDVFYEGDAGPYRLFVSVRTPPVIPGVATLEIRTSDPGVREVRVVPMRLTGPGSKLPPAPDLADRSSADPQFFTASLWLMERGALQVRVAVDGPKGEGQLAVPVPAVATRVLPMTTGLQGLLLGLMVLLSAAAVSIARSGARDALLEPGATPQPNDIRRGRLASVIAFAAVGGVVGGGRAWWSAAAQDYAASVYSTPQAQTRVEGGRLFIAHQPLLAQELLPDHGHLMHVFLVRETLDEVFHLHPERRDGAFSLELPAVRGGRYRLFADVVTKGGFPITLEDTLEFPAREGAALTGDDSTWNDAMPFNGKMEWSEPQRPLRAGAASPFRFSVTDAEGQPAGDLEPYMGMAGHAVFIKKDFSVFAHVHPVGSVAMPALELANETLGGVDPHAGHAMGGPLPPAVSFPYGVPSAGEYRVFVQVKRNGRVETGVFDAHAD